MISRRVLEAISGSYSGTMAMINRGLGLDIVRHLCSTVGARVTVASEPGRGTCFTLQLPRRMRPGRAHPDLRHDG